MITNRSIYSLTKAELRDWLRSNDEKPSRADLIWKALYVSQATEFGEMTDLTGNLRQKLGHHFAFDPLEVEAVQEAGDETTKYLFRLRSGSLIETVLMHHDYGSAVCVTTQVGCNMGCRFCASGLLKKQRDLEAGEIIAQILYVIRHLQVRGSARKVSHVTVMGIGEPFDNYEELLRFLTIVTDQKGLSIAPRRITVSTSGLAPKIRQFAQEDLPVNLAVSLHAPTDAIRSRLMRINDAYPLTDLFPAIEDYIRQTNHRVFFEYIMIKALNDRPEHAEALADRLAPLGKSAYVNLISYNPVPEADFERSDRADISRFFDVLMQRGVNCIIRRELGADIDGACGQLRSRHIRQAGK